MIFRGLQHVIGRRLLRAFDVTQAPLLGILLLRAINIWVAHN